MAPYCLRWNFPVWMPDRELDPTRLLGVKQERDITPRKDMEPGEFVSTFFHENPISQARVFENASREGLSQRRIGQLLNLSVEAGLLYRWPMPNRTFGFATSPLTQTDCLKVEIINEITKNPGIDNEELARKFGLTERRIRQIKEEICG